jgi:hypothetical protein
MVASTYPQTGRNLRELLLWLIAEDASMQYRLLGPASAERSAATRRPHCAPRNWSA